MSRYDFIGVGCPNAPEDKTCSHVLEFPMKKAPKLDACVACPLKCGAKVMRVISSGIGAIVRGHTEVPWNHGERIQTQINGKEVSFEFVDHPHTDPAYQRNLQALAGKQGVGGCAAGIGKSRMDEKTGRIVVDVKSNVEDPLGMLQRSKKDGQYTETKVDVNQKVKARGKLGTTLPVGAAMSKAKARRAKR